MTPLAGLLIWVFAIAVTVFLAHRGARAAVRAVSAANRRVNADIAFMRAIPGGE